MGKLAVRFTEYPIGRDVIYERRLYASASRPLFAATAILIYY